MNAPLVRTHVRITWTLLIAACAGNSPAVTTSKPAAPAVIVAEAAPVPAPTPAPAPAATPSEDIYIEPPDVTDRCILSVRDPDLKTWAHASVEPRVNEGCEGCGGETIDQIAAEASKGASRGGVCDVRTRETLERSIRAGTTPGTAANTPWDHRSQPAYLDVVNAALSLTADEQHQLSRDGLVVPARLAYDDYSSAYYDIHRGQLPIFVTADSILHAVYASHDKLLANLETEELIGRLDRALGEMHCMLATASKSYPKEVADDLDLYLTVARSLLSGRMIRSERGTLEAATRLFSTITQGGALTTIDLFGRARAFDPSAFVPRGHYAGDGQLETYFRAAMWMSRLELNLVSRDTRSSQPGFVPDPSETPREAVDALALADLADRSGALADLETIDQAWSAFAGAREDVSLAELVALRKQAKIGKLEIPQSAEQLRAVIGDRFQRTLNTHPNPDVPHLPVIATAIGPRVTPDSLALAALPVSNDSRVAASQLGFALGHDRALPYIGGHPDRPQLDKARELMAHARGKADLYGAWLDAILALADKPVGTVPSFMKTPVFEDLRLDTALVAYGQLRHNHVLVESQMYNVGGCEIPDGYVEPAPAVYDRLAEWARRGERVFGKLDPKDKTGGTAYFKRVARLLGVLTTIARDELANRTLSADEKRFLSMVVEMREASAWNYNGPYPVPTYDGWYLDLFPSDDDAFHNASFIADYGTHVVNDARWVDYLGAKGPHLGLFVVDVNGAPRVMAGPVAQAYAATGPVAHRFTDETQDQATAIMPWSANYTVGAPTEPTLEVSIARADATLQRHLSSPKPQLGVIEIESPRDQGDATIELRDHHFVKVDTLAVHVGKGKTIVKLPASAAKIESLTIHLGEFQGRVDIPINGVGSRHFGPIAAAHP